MKDTLVNTSVSILINGLFDIGLEPIGVILTGSFSREEGSILETEEENIVLGDIEFLVIFPQNYAKSLNNIKQELKKISKLASNHLQKKGYICEVEYTPACPGYLSGFSTSIFTYELSLHHKVVWGYSSVSSYIKKLKANDIPKIDGLFLLCNRSIEQLQIFMKLCSTDAPLKIHDFYNIIKLYIDIAGSLLLFSNNYQPTYTSRQNSFFPTIIECNHPLHDKLLIHKDDFDKAFSFKLHPTLEAAERMWGINNYKSIPKEFVYSHMAKIASILIPVWKWEANFIANLSTNNDSLNFENSLAKITTKSKNFKMWLKWFKIYFSNNRGYYFNFSIDKVWQNPQIICYLEAFQLYCYIFNEFRSLESFSLESGFNNNDTYCYPYNKLIKVIRIWENYIRTN